MNKYVSEKSNCSAWVILKGNKQVGKVQAHYGNSVVTVNAWDFSRNGDSFQAGKASGYGYDKFTSALSGLTIDGITLNDHCGQNEKTEKLLAEYTEEAKKGMSQERKQEWQEKVKRIGARFANYSCFYNGKEKWNFEGDEKKAKKEWRYTSLYLESGLDKLKVLGYSVIQAI